MFSGKFFKVRPFFALFGVVALVLGVYMTFFQTKGFEKTEAVIVSIEEYEEADDTTGHTVMVRYTVDGKEYTEELGAYSPGYKEGAAIDILYNPKNPSVIHAEGKGFGVYVIVVGIGLLAFVIYGSVQGKKGTEQLKKLQGETTYAPSLQGEERELYFITDTGTAKFGHRLENASRQVLYEAKVTKFTLNAPIGFEFIDHVNNKKTDHLVGHEESSENDSFLIDNYYTFSFDGEDIWDHLKKHGISMKTESQEGKALSDQYRIFRDGQEIALAKTTGSHVHEEDEETKGKLANLIPSQYFYRVFTREQNLDLLFISLMALARTGAITGEGGSVKGLVFGKLTGKQ